MSIGYACLAVAVPNSEMKSLSLSRVSVQTLLDVCKTNIEHLNNLLTYTKEQNMQLFRISSDLIPFGSSEANTLPWWDIFSDELASIGALAARNNIRLSMHPGQYTVLNSPRKEVVDNAIADLVHHAKVLSSLGSEGKIVLHIGGAYGNKGEATKRFITTYRSLPYEVKQRIVIENDDTLYTIGEVLDIAHEVGCPAVFDNLHHALNPSAEALTEWQWIEACATTWKECDGKQKIHYSQPDPTKRAGSHSATIDLHQFLKFYGSLPDTDIDIMLEVKDKNISALKCMHCTKGATKDQLLTQWQKYRPLVTERDPSKVWDVEELLEGSEEGLDTAIAFYRLLDETLALQVVREQATITANAMAKLCIRTPAEQRRIENRIISYKRATLPLHKLKQSIQNIANKHAVNEVLSSYYCML